MTVRSAFSVGFLLGELVMVVARDVLPGFIKARVDGEKWRPF